MAGAVRRSQDEVREAWLWSPDSAGSPSTPVGKGVQSLVPLHPCISPPSADNP